MNVVGHGIDTIDFRRFTILAEDERYVASCFTESEIRSVGKSDGREHRLAARFAAKEAVLKALGTGLVDGIRLKDVEVVFEKGRPGVRLSGEIARIATDLGVAVWHLSMSHGTEHAIASAIACSAL